MEFLPLFFDLKESTALVFGASDAAARKVEVLLKANCRVCLVAATLNKSLNGHLDSPIFKHYLNDYDELWALAHLVVAATDDVSTDEKISETAKSRKLPVNVVNRVDLSNFVFPSIIDRSPIIAAVSSSGELPVLTRLLRSRLEATIPHAFGRMAIIARKYRAEVKQQITSINTRRNFWENVLEGRFADLVFSGQEEAAENELKEKLKQQLSNNNQIEGEVYLVGAGPGDPDLLTFKALRLIRQADVVLYDRLVSEPILALVKQDAEKINVGKERSNHLVPQDSINSLLVKYAKAGKRVLRLKGGDPFIFGRGGEEIETLADEGVSFQVVPGITAASGCAAYSGIPLTHRDYSQSVRFITGHLKNNTCDLPWQEFVHENQTLVFYMGLTGLPIICESLTAYGMSQDKPIALISKGTTRDQKVLVGTLSTISNMAIQAKVSAPTLIIIGDVVNLREKLKWFS
ncbi:MAG: uroporphyrin-III C-methyltransferase/precorrin-2 dehydrogenase/sirohydrochlorin ferrochelatase [Pseudohongiellaceae bacterium]|jgi:uroporphyrin-III C-methyltransferase/precorrin-2 dehydrogenase/sirohydrochlorin ferrochelatase